MSSEPHAVELLPAYALGSLDTEEAIQVTEHVTDCPTCRTVLAPYQAVVDRLALAVPDAAPRPELKRQLMGCLQTPSAAPGLVARPSWWRHIAGLFRSGAPAWGVATLTLVAVLVITNLLWWRQTQQHEPMVASGGMQVVAMIGTEAAPAAVGTLVISEDGEYGTLVVDGLPILDEEYQYQLWLIRDDHRTSGGVFSVGEEGYGALLISSPAPLSSYPSFGVTIEPAGGSTGPTGEKVLGADL